MLLSPPQFENLEHANCLGADSSKWKASFNGHTSDVTLSNDDNAVSTFKTPLKVTHAQDCSTVAPALTLQMDTTVDGDLKVQRHITQTLPQLDGSSVTADITMRHLANLLMFSSARKLYVKNAHTGRYLNMDSGNSPAKLKTTDTMGGHEKFMIITEVGKNLDEGNRGGAACRKCPPKGWCHAQLATRTLMGLALGRPDAWPRYALASLPPPPPPESRGPIRS